jgi:cobalt-zinc-cadmium efflux system outer membrane protein
MMQAVIRHLSKISYWFIVISIFSPPMAVSAQVTTASAVPGEGTTSIYLDPVNGKTANDLVRLALDNNGELVAMRKEAEAAENLVKQARLRANPMLEIGGAKRIGGTDNNETIQAAQPLELGGRRSTRIRVAEGGLDIRKQAVAEKERELAADVRSKFGEALASATKLKFADDVIGMEKLMFELVAARVSDGRTAPLEQNMESVELNRMRAERETVEGVVEMRMFELRNLAGMNPEEPLRLRGDFVALLDAAPPQDIATGRALQTRPDLVGARAVEQMQTARIEQAEAEGRIDADVMFGYQRMDTSFPLLGIQESSGALLPIEERMHFFTFGIRLNLPVSNRNQGAIEAAELEGSAATARRQYGELTVKREIASAYARYDRALRAMEIYRVGVRDQAAANVDVVRQTYDLGSKTMLDYIGEHHHYMATENGFIDAELEAYLARVEILRATYAPELINK